MKIRKQNGRSVQELMEIRGFTKYGVDTVGGELLFFRLAPVNISVLSQENVAIRIHALQQVLTQMPDLEILCTDSCESFDANRLYLLKRAYQESNAAVRRLLHQDAEILLEMQGEMATARQFVFIRRCKGLKPEQVQTLANDTHKTIAGSGFQVQRMGKEDIKRFLAIYFKASMDGDQLPDVDGAQYAKGAKKK